MDTTEMARQILNDRPQPTDLEILARDPWTGQRYAIGFDADGNPYRAYPVFAPAGLGHEDDYIYAA